MRPGQRLPVDQEIKNIQKIPNISTITDIKK